MKRLDRKSDCAINVALEHIGDPWSLLIIRDMVYFGKRTYGEFLASDERIGTSVLARKLAALEQTGIIRKATSPSDGRKEEYSLTSKGLGLIPILNELSLWGATHDSRTAADQRTIASYNTDRQGVTDRMTAVVAGGGHVVASLSDIYRL